MCESDEIIQEFIGEGRDMIDEVEPLLIDLQNISSATGSADEDTINTIFRTFHSIKGSAGFLEFNVVNRLTHNAETLLDLFRKGKAEIAPEHIDIFCRSLDFLREAFSEIETRGTDKGFEEEAEGLVERLKAMIRSAETGESPPPPADDTEETESVEEKTDSTEEAGTPAEEPPEQEPDSPSEIDMQLALVTQEMNDRFITESDDLLTLAEQVLLDLEKNPENADEIVTEALRSVHSFKGNCGFMGYADLERLSHTLETVMESIKDGEIECAGGNLDLILKVIDVLESGVADISQGGQGLLEDCSVLCVQLKELQPEEEIGLAEPGKAPAKDSSTSEVADAGTKKEEAKQATPAESGAEEKPKAAEPAPKSAPEDSEKDASEQMKVKKNKRVVRRDIRVDLEKMDLLINLVGELVIAEAMVVNNPDLKGYEFEQFERAAAHMNRIVRDLQDVAMSVRMIPISGTFRKMIRLVHDVANKAGKKVALELKGEDTEIDKTVAELIADPLVHIIRNAVDHGIDTADERKEAGKPDVGKVELEARHEGGEVWITIRDDGRGINREKVLAKAQERGLISGNGANMTDNEVYRLVFEPGFSTAEKVTDVSGRGVGMDVVKKNIEKLKGSVDVHSQLGQGSIFILRIPLTLAIIEGMLVRVGAARYTLPILTVKESIRLTDDQVTTTMDGQEVARVRDDLIPVVRLCDLHHVKPDYENLNEGILVIIENQKRTIALFVDEILGQHQAVIKGLSDYVGSVKSVAGCTILGDGDISLILDPAGIFKMVMKKVDRTIGSEASIAAAAAV